ncbi:MAG: UvrD-helicase domain-containing protein [Puniceicoccales bacterium]|jgi:ATP-dependent exoDNAse (exonuclease V) beta subunit|nr:UvrD-helicase domain-containing protein [Puniceicoccales bacterium]
MTQLPDQMQRDRFANEICENFSVIAPAGVGKTTAISERIANAIVSMSTGGNSSERRLIAVTYTEKAANEIRDRVFRKIFQKTENAAPLREVCMRLAETVFFGTIHAFASNFLKSNCALIGIRDDFEIVDDTDALWEDFIFNFGSALDVIPVEIRPDFLCAHDVDKLLVRVKDYGGDADVSCEIPAAPAVDISRILNHGVKKNETKAVKFLQLLAEWDNFRRGGIFYKMPDFFEICGGKNFVEFCSGELKDFLEWKDISEKFFLRKMAHAYRDFRLSIGKLKYDDLIALSIELLRNETVIGEMEKSPYSVILDEAQDTDSQQFRLLLGVSQRVLRHGISIDVCAHFPEAGYFSMVGDPQQSIYCDRADVKFYMRLHELLVNSENASELTFSVTMRCPVNIALFANEKFHRTLADMKFVPLEPKPGAECGELKIIELEAGRGGESVANAVEQICALFAGKTPEEFGAEKWSDVAILAPRREWLTDIAGRFSGDETLPQAQLHFGRDQDNAASAVRWLASCMKYINNPADRREFAGILREIFGMTSADIIEYFRRDNCAECSAIDGKFAALRGERHALPLAKFLLKILSEFEIFQRIDALNIFAEDNFSEQVKRTVELCYFAETKSMNPVEAENFLAKKISRCDESKNVNREAVQFLTFHKSKGLEWPVVMLPFMYRGRQLTRSEVAKHSVADLRGNECRLLYVACTRAKNRLIIVDDSEIFGHSGNPNIISSGAILLDGNF